MTRAELVDRIDAVMAYDFGASDSGIKDDEFKASLKDRNDIVELMTDLVRQYVLSDEGYTYEDVVQMVHWAEEQGIYL